MGKSSRRKRERRERDRAMRTLAERDRTKTFNAARARVSVGGVPIGFVDSFSFNLDPSPAPYAVPYVIFDSFPGMSKRSISVSGEVRKFDVKPTYEELERQLAASKAHAASLEAVLGDRLEEQGAPRSVRLAKLLQLGDIDQIFDEIYERLQYSGSLASDRFYQIMRIIGGEERDEKDWAWRIYSGEMMRSQTIEPRGVNPDGGSENERSEREDEQHPR